MLNDFPPCPIKGTERLAPLASWLQINHELKTTGVEYEQFWDEAVHEGVAYFFQWVGHPRATVLAIWQQRRLTHVEARKAKDEPLSQAEAEPIIAEVVHAFEKAGFINACKAR